MTRTVKYVLSLSLQKRQGQLGLYLQEGLHYVLGMHHLYPPATRSDLPPFHRYLLPENSHKVICDFLFTMTSGLTKSDKHCHESNF